MSVLDAVYARPSNDGDDDAPVAVDYEKLRADGFVIGMGDDDAGYHADPCKHISLNVTIGKVLINECADDARAQHPRLGGVRLETTDAQQEGALFDALLTGSLDYSQSDKPQIWERSNKKTKTVDTVCYSDWNGLRVIDADSFTPMVARECRDDAVAKGLQPVLQSDLEEAVEKARLLQVRMELAGVDLQAGKRQVPVYWVELADDGTPVQCRGKLDQLDGFVIRDLKKVASLRGPLLSRQVYDYGWDIQAAAYKRALERITGDFGRYRFEWAFIRVGKLLGVRKVEPDGYRMELGMRRWRVAVNRWAKCMRENFWPGYELDPMRMSVEPWMDTQVSELEGVADGE